MEIYGLGKTNMVNSRSYIAPLGEYYYDCLVVEAYLKGRTVSSEGASLLCHALMRREEYRNQMVEYCARKRGITPEQMWQEILTGEAKPMTPDQFKELQSQQGEGEPSLETDA